MKTPTRNIHSIPSGTIHKAWNRRLEPVLEVEPGDTVTLSPPDASNGEITPQSTSETISRIDYRKLDPLVGPVYVNGAQPGDALKVEVVELKPRGWGWTGLIPDFGLLADEIRVSYIKIWDLNAPFVEAPNGERFDLQPMIGCIGVAPGKDGEYRSITPTDAAGNMDCKYLGVGSTLLIPVFNDGALLSAADGHALQGDGELSGTGIECPMDMTLRVDLVKEANLTGPEVITAEFPVATEGYHIFMGIAPDLMQATKEAVRRAIPAFAKAQGIDEIEAYALLGVFTELRILEVVDEPNWVVGCMLPKRLMGRSDRA